MTVRFGTDGLRGRAGDAPLDRATLRRIGAAVGVWLQRTGPAQKRVVIGDDGRASATWIRSALAEGLCASDVACVDLGLTTTPALAFLTRAEPAQAGIMISASHNPASDNGIKIFADDGGKLSDDAEREIEGLVEEIDAPPDDSPALRSRPELLLRYEQHLADVFGDLDLDGVRIAVDAANGGGAVLAPRVLRAFGADVVEFACNPDGDNINAGVGALHPHGLAEVVRAEKAQFGLCLDGDGDRGIFIDAGGAIRDGDQVLAVLGRELAKAGRLPDDTVVATVMSNLGLHRVLERAGLRVEVTPVGDRAVVQAMREGGFALGGEQSGHIIFAGDGHLTGDGLFTALKLLAIAAVRDGRLHELCADFTPYPQLLINVPVDRKPPLDSLPSLQAEVARIETELHGDGRVLLRYSGTENLCRVMIEGPTEAVVELHANALADAVRRELT